MVARQSEKSEPLSPVLICLLVPGVGLLELADGVLQASDLGFLLIKHHDESRVQFLLKRFLIPNLLLQPGKKRHVHECARSQTGKSFEGALFVCLVFQSTSR